MFTISAISTKIISTATSSGSTALRTTIDAPRAWTRCACYLATIKIGLRLQRPSFKRSMNAALLQSSLLKH
ncbi:hypothetical protein D3C86_1093180 [compost metagenome]